jgi:hypothetical protein
MPLEIAILDEAGRPVEKVDITPEQHWRIVEEAKRLGLVLWRRMADYYADADYCRADLHGLAAETAQIRSSLTDPGVCATLASIEDLLRTAMRMCRTVAAIAD